MDFKPGINKWIIPSIHPLPRPSEIFDQVGKFNFFSKLDISQAYHHIALDSESQHLTAFTSPWHGLCVYTRVPMGMSDSGDAFQKCIDHTLSGLQGVFAYSDDILIGGSTREEHDSRLRAVFQCLDEHNYRLKKPKVAIAKQQVTMLGHLISSESGITTINPDPKNVEAILKLPEPSDIHGVRQITGSCNYFKDFIPDYAELTEPLHQLTRKNTPFRWTELCSTSFRTLKKRISSPECLVPFDPNCETFLTTDASDVGLGAELSQMVGNTERPVAFAAKTLNQAQRNYSTPEREALAVVWATEHFEKYLLGRYFTLRTDQNSLTTLMTGFSDSTRASKRIARWCDRLQHHNYTVVHIKGKENCVADMLSRLASENQTSSEPALLDDNDDIIVASLALDSSSRMEEIANTSQSDPLLIQIKKYMVTVWPEKKSLSGDIRVFFKHRNELSVHGECLFLGERLVIPSESQESILKLLHSGHPGRICMQQKYRDAYFWPGGTERVTEYLKNCNACSLTGKNTHSEPVKTTAIPPPDQPWKKVAIDITGPFFTAPKHDRFIVAISCYFSKYPEILFTNRVNSPRLISWLKEVFGRFGVPDELVSDNGPQFTSTMFKNFLAENSIKHNLSAVYNPQQNGMIEVLNRSFKKGAQINSCEQGKSFRDGIQDLVNSFRSTAPENGESPYKLLLGYNPRTNSDVRNPLLFLSGGDKAATDYRNQQLDFHLSMDQKKEIVKTKFNKRRYGLNPVGS
ncbi:MAG: DDE-type integrase/transposase/recombinase, partial [Desulfobulbaceae bacterium]|nr:DDE-type integrase/transposase/recombinase [Desulfobulbaceae bacterium]